MVAFLWGLQPIIIRTIRLFSCY